MRPDSTPVKPRQTFLRWHLLGGTPFPEPGIDPSTALIRNPGELFRTDEVLGLDFLRRSLRVRGVPESVQRQAQDDLTLQSFFYGLRGAYEGFPDLTLYRPVPVRLLDGNHDGTRRQYEHLPDLLADLDQAHASHGVLLTARSGAGKTVAEVRAMWDCIQPRVEIVTDENGNPKKDAKGNLIRIELPPLLDGFIPCRIRPTGPPPSGGTIEHYLLQAAGLTGEITPAQLQAYLKWGPKLLVFCDLNAVAPKHREPLVQALRDFQGNADYRRAGHRIVVAFRSTEAERPLVEILNGNDAFRSYDLLPIQPQQAEEYVRCLREVESAIYVRCGVTPPERDLDAEVRQLHEFIDRWTTNGESLISTPLLMHFVSMLRPQDFAAIQTLGDLYGAVTHRILEYNRHQNPLDRRHLRQSRYLERMPQFLQHESGDAQAIALMTRVALAILSQGAAVTRLPLSDLRSLLTSPKQVTAEKSPMWPREDEPQWGLSSSPIYRNVKDGVAYQLSDSDIRGLLEFSLLHHDQAVPEADQAPSLIPSAADEQNV